MSVKINKHVFHGLYSNLGYAPSFSSGSTNVLWGDYPIHTQRAIVGANDAENSTGNTKRPKAFENEEAAFKWYKKNKYGESEFNSLNFPEDFCKNYFTIPETEFFKYRNYFHGMVKSILLKWNYSIEYEGSHESLDDCECSSSSSSSSSSSDSSSSSSDEGSGSGGPSSQTFLEILQILQTEKILATIQEEDNCCYCPSCDTPEEDRSKIKCSSNFNAKFSVDINIDTKKIFDIPEFQSRIGAVKLSRYFRPSFKDNKETQDELSDNITKLYKENWVLDTEWDKEFKSEKNFPQNSTRINDPVILYTIASDGGYGVGGVLNSSNYLNFNILLGDNKEGLPKEIITSQQQEKKSDNLGSIKIKVNSTNAYFTRAGIRFYIGLSNICYIKSEKKFMCFVEISSETDDNKNHYIDQAAPEDWEQLFPIYDSDISPLTIFSTYDLYKKEKMDETHFSCPGGDETGIKLKKDKLSIKIDDQTADIEVYTPEKTEFKYKSWKTGVSKTGCRNFDLEKNCSTDEYTKKWIFNKPTIELLTWKEDFSKGNIFPPRVS
jgi:hypothetical protein